MTGTMDEIKEQVDENMKPKNIEIPPQLYLMPLQSLQSVTATNVNLVKIQPMVAKFQNTVDDLILRSNVHKCRNSIPADEKKQKKERRGCINKHGNCKARFPKQTFEKTEVILRLEHLI